MLGDMLSTGIFPDSSPSRTTCGTGVHTDPHTIPGLVTLFTILLAGGWSWVL